MQAFYLFYFLKQRLCIFSQKLSNKNKQRLYKIQKHPTSLFYHSLLIKQNECKENPIFQNLKYLNLNVGLSQQVFSTWHHPQKNIQIIVL